MTIAELIEKLKQYDSSKSVRIMDGDGDLVHIDIVCEIQDGAKSLKTGDILLLDAEWDK